MYWPLICPWFLASAWDSRIWGPFTRIVIRITTITIKQNGQNYSSNDKNHNSSGNSSTNTNKTSNSNIDLDIDIDIA